MKCSSYFQIEKSEESIRWIKFGKVTICRADRQTENFAIRWSLFLSVVLLVPHIFNGADFTHIIVRTSTSDIYHSYIPTSGFDLITTKLIHLPYITRHYISVYNTVVYISVYNNAVYTTVRII